LTETVDVTSGADVVETIRIRIQLRMKKAFQYSLAVGGKTYEGKGDVDGIIDHEVPAGASTGTLTATVEDTEEAMRVQLGDFRALSIRGA
jgi:hypothetical protein